MNNNIVVILVVFALVFGGLYVGGNLVIDKVCDRVIEKLQREYSPGPYHPGFDPDKVNPDFFRQQQQQQPQPQAQYKQYYQPQNPFKKQQPQPPFQQQYYQPKNPFQAELRTPEEWNRYWESLRR